MKRALTIAGSDSGGGAGIQADLKTFAAFGVFGMSVITAITAQNTCEVTAISEVPLQIIEKQIDAVISDIGTDAVKTGMLANTAIVRLVAESIEKYGLQNVVVDPVMISKSGDSLIDSSAITAMKEYLIPLVKVITPNIPEAMKLLGREINGVLDMEEAAVELHKLGCEYVVLKGGHLEKSSDAIDIVYDGNQIQELRSLFFKSDNTHGTGCTFASAIAAGLAKGYKPLRAFQMAKKYITHAIKSSFPLGKGHGPVNHNTGVTAYW
jgi:hydroxymethylpyrimidine/phosphomethylpyrimidine kinase